MDWLGAVAAQLAVTFGVAPDVHFRSLNEALLDDCAVRILRCGVVYAVRRLVALMVANIQGALLSKIRWIGAYFGTVV